MRRLDENRFEPGCWQAALATMAALLCSSFGTWAQPVNGENAAQVVNIVIGAQKPTPEELGDALMAHRRYQAAIEAFKQDPKPSAAVWNKMGIAYQMLFDLQDATLCYKTSLKMNPKSPNVLNNLGTVYDSMKQFKQAVKMYRKALKYEPDSALVLKNLGTDLLAQHKYEKGWEVYKQALAADPQIFERNMGPKVENPASVQDRGAMNFYMAKGCVRAGRTERAIEYLRMALNEGFTSPKKIAADQEFAVLHGQPAFEKLMSDQTRDKQ